MTIIPAIPQPFPPISDKQNQADVMLKTKSDKLHVDCGWIMTESHHVQEQDEGTVVTSRNNPAKDDIGALLEERGKKYGDFGDFAAISQSLKTVCSNAENKSGKYLPDYQREALGMICHKIARILNGDSNYDDSWRDIAGYAKLVADKLSAVSTD